MSICYHAHLALFNRMESAHVIHFSIQNCYQSLLVILIIKLYYDLLTLGYLLSLSMTHTNITSPFIVHYTTVYLTHHTRLNFSTPNLQCQYSRSGLMCGQCQQGLSTVFGSSQCQHCSSSNYYLFLIIPFAIAGLVLVLLLFTLNLTVTDGDINGFILYINVISINSHVFFPVNNFIQPSYTFVPIAKS